MNGVFVSYRRSDSSGHAGRIHDRLVEFYGDDRVFRDLEDIAAGDDFVATIRETLAKRDVLLVVIGPSWLTITDESGNRRLDDPRDIVRLEVAEALNQANTRVIPVLVNGATMPRAEDLPAPLASLATRNAFEVLDTRFADDVTRLIKTIGGRKAGQTRKLLLSGAFTLLIATATTTLLIPILAGQPKVVADINVYRGGGTVSGDEREAFMPVAIPDTSALNGDQTAPLGRGSLHTVSYSHQRHALNDVTINAALPYRDSLLKGGPVTANGATIRWEWPRLSVQIVNNSDETLYVSGVEIEVKGSTPDTEPLFYFREQGDESIRIVNYGWGGALNPGIEVSVVPGDCDGGSWEETDRTPLDIGNARIRGTRIGVEGPVEPFGPGVFTTLDVSSAIPLSLADPNRPACVLGVLHYDTESGEQRTVRFTTPIRVSRMGTLASVSPKYEYFVYLEAGVSDYVKNLSIDHAIQPGSVDHFLIRVGTNQSASFDLSFRIRAVGRDPFLADDVQLTILTPTSDSDGLRNPEQRR